MSRQFILINFNKRRVSVCSQIPAPFLGFIALFLATVTITRADLSYPPFLINEVDGTSIGADARKVVVLIHGWTNETPGEFLANPDDRYAQGQPNDFKGQYAKGEWSWLYTSLKLKCQQNGWKLICYHWEQDASTGHVTQSNYPYFTLGPPGQAAQNAVSHGVNLGPYLDDVTNHNLREVHFIAHSAGSWAAREAMRTLLQANPYVVTQITLLDPYIPDGNSSTGLSVATMSANVSFTGLDRVHRMENYYADDSPEHGWDQGRSPWAPTIDTQFEFAWRIAPVWPTTIDINQPVHHGPFLSAGGVIYNTYYDYHSGPVSFYNDTVSATMYPPPDGLVLGNPPFQYMTVGYYRSLLYQDTQDRPRVVVPPSSLTVTYGDPITLTSSSIGGSSYTWFKAGNQVNNPNGSSQTLAIPNATYSDAGDYVVRVSNSSGMIFSDAATIRVLQPGPTPTPTPGAPVAPTVQTLQPTNLTSSSATLQGVVNYTGGASLVETRFEWTAATFPANVIYNVPLSGSNFFYTLTGLQPNTQYTYHAYAKNAAGLWNTNPNNVSFVTPQPSTLPNLTPCQPAGWSDKIVVSKVLGTNTDSSGLLPSDNLYVDWGVVNAGAATTASFYSQLFVDNLLRNTWVTTPIGAGNVQTVLDFPIGSLNAGTHFLTIKTDVTGLIPENNENDNDYTKTIVVGSPTPTPTPSPNATPPGYLVVNPTNFSIGSGFGNDLFTISNTGAGPVEASMIADSWITITNSNVSVGSGRYTPVNFTYLLNTSTLARTGTITITSPGSINSPQTIYIVQAGQSPVPTPPPASPTPTPTPPGPTPTPNPISDAKPNFLWARDSGFIGNGVAVDPFGNTYVVGSLFGTISLGGQTLIPIGSPDIVLAKFGANGNFVWVRQVGAKSSTWTASDSGNGIATDANGNVYITGAFTQTVSFGSYTFATGAGTTAAFIAKFDSSGNVIWANAGVAASIGGFARGQAIGSDSSGNSYLTGYFSGSVAFGVNTFTSTGGQKHMYLAKYDSAGNFVWFRQAGGSGYDQPAAVTVDSNSSSCYVTGGSSSPSITFGNLAVTRVPGSSSGSSMMFVVKYDHNGTPIWATGAFPGNTSSGVYSNGIAVDTAGNAFVAGQFSSNMVLGSQTANSIGPTDIYLCKLDPSGNLAWLWETGGAGLNSNGFKVNCYSSATATDRNGNCYVTGYFQGAVPFGSTTLTSLGGNDVFVARFNEQGNPDWAVQAGGAGDDFGTALQVDPSGNAYVVGSASGAGTFGNFQLSANAFLTKVGVPRYTISLGVDTANAGVTAGGGTYPQDGQVTAVATANSGYVFQGWFENGSLVWPNPSYSFQAISDRTLVASFVLSAVPTPPPTSTPSPKLVGVVSRKTQGNGTFDIDLPLSGTLGIECRSGGTGGNHSLIFTFNNSVVSGDITVTSGNAAIVGRPTVSANTMVVNLSGVPNAQLVTFSLKNVTDTTAQVLPDTPFSVGFLLGDVNATGLVDGNDVSAVQGHTRQGVDATNFVYDVDTSGLIDGNDVSTTQKQTRSGLSSANGARQRRTTIARPTAHPLR